MIAPNQRAALAALDAARPIVARLDPARHAEENAADLIEVWSSVETALRSLMGGSALSGQPLIRELRQRELLSLDQAHSLLELLAVRERVQRTDYQPSPSDITVAHEAFDKLASGIGVQDSATATLGTGSSGLGTRDSAVAAEPPQGAGESRVPMIEPRRSAPRAAIIIAAVVVLALAGGLTWYFTVGRSPSALQAGIAAYDAGQREKARGELTQAVRQDPSLSLPHVYLGRIAREEGDFGTAGTELAAAVRNDTSSALARRELASFFLARGQQFAAQGRPDLAAADFDAARRHYVRAIQLDPSDRSAQGFLGCTLARLGRAQEAASWIARAGQGPWTSCASAAPPTSPAAATGAARPHGS